MGNRSNQRQADIAVWSASSAEAERGRGPRTWGFRDLFVAQAVGEEVDRVRVSLDMSQRELAEHLRVSQPQINYYLKGKDQMSLGMLFDIEEILGLEPGHLFATALKARSKAETTFSSR